MATVLPISGLPDTEQMATLAILKRWAKTNARFGLNYPKLLYKRIFIKITIQKVLVLKFTEGPTTEF